MMTDFEQLLKQRRSIRDFLDKPVPESLILQLIEDSCLAPSAANNQPWHFIVVLDKEMIKAMLAAQETLASTLAGAGETAANHGDTLTEDLCIARGQIHEKYAWMLRAHLR